jgi:putative transposase
MRRSSKISIDEYYHLYSRGVNKMLIFNARRDYERFQRLLYLANDEKPLHYCDLKPSQIYTIAQEKPLVSIGCYCLMPNHFHILIKEIAENGITRFMRRLLTAYSMYFNTKYERAGALFESRYKASHVSRDEYLKYLFSYISLNPVKKIEKKWKLEGIRNLVEAKKYLNRYSFSSYRDHIGFKRKETRILTPTAFPDYFFDQYDFEHYINDWLMFNSEGDSTRSVLEDGPRGNELST